MFFWKIISEVAAFFSKIMRLKVLFSNYIFGFDFQSSFSKTYFRKHSLQMGMGPLYFILLSYILEARTSFGIAVLNNCPAVIEIVV